ATYYRLIHDIDAALSHATCAHHLFMDVNGDSHHSKIQHIDTFLHELRSLQEQHPRVAIDVPHNAKEYSDALQTVLGDDTKGRPIIIKQPTSTGYSLYVPLFWLKQLGGKAIQELSDNLGVVTQEKLKTLKRQSQSVSTEIKKNEEVIGSE